MGSYSKRQVEAALEDAKVSDDLIELVLRKLDTPEQSFVEKFVENRTGHMCALRSKKQAQLIELEIRKQDNERERKMLDIIWSLEGRVSKLEKGTVGPRDLCQECGEELEDGHHRMYCGDCKRDRQP